VTVAKPIRLRSGVYVTGLNETLRFFKHLPDQVDQDTRKASGRIADRIVGEARMAAGTTPYKVHRLAAQGLSRKQTRAGKIDRIPTVVLGNRQLLPGRGGRRNTMRQRYDSIAAGAEFGGSKGSRAATEGKRQPGESYTYRSGRRLRTSTYRRSTSQFPPYKRRASGKGGEGYFLYPTVRRLGPWAVKEWDEAVGAAIRKA
jgi:hypothetical protein